jgi:hypothetical protein
MIALIAGNYLEAKAWARGQLLDPDEWFFPEDEYDLLRRQNFHVLVVGTAGHNTPPSYFERILQTAKTQGRKGRV